MINKYELLDLDLYLALLLELKNFRSAISLYQIIEKLKIVNCSKSKREYFVNSLLYRGVITSNDSGIYVIDQKKLFLDFLNSNVGRKIESVINDNSIISPWYRGKSFK